MIDKALEYFAKLARDSAPRIHQIPGDPRGSYLVIDGDGGVMHHEPSLGPHDHEAYVLDTVVDVARRWKATDIWYSRAEVTAAVGKDVVTMTLAPSPQMKTIAGWGSLVALGQADFIRLLRTIFPGMVAPNTLLGQVRRLDFKKAEEYQSQIEAGKISVSRKATAEAVGGDQMPETVVFTVPVFANSSLRGVTAKVEVALDIDTTGERFNLAPVAGQIELAFGAGEDQVANRLLSIIEDDEFLVCYGVR